MKTYLPGQETAELMQWIRSCGFNPSEVFKVDIGRRSGTVHWYRTRNGRIMCDADGELMTVESRVTV